MSQLYIRVRTGFFTHRKTLRLRSLIGDDAYWVVPRLWAYAAENQADGNMSGYSSEELALLIGCSKHAPSIRQALLDAGYLDADGRIHDWGEHNGYHKSYSDRARTAALARWAKEKSPTPPKESTEKEERGKGRQALLGACLEHGDGKRRGTLQQILGFCAQQGIPASDAEWFFFKCEGNGWTNNGKPIKDWRATIRSWKAGGFLPSQKGQNAGHSNGSQKRSPSEERNFFTGTDAAEHGRRIAAAVRGTQAPARLAKETPAGP